MATRGPWPRTCICAIALGPVMVILCLGIAGLRTTTGRAADGPVYSVRALVAQLERPPGTRLDRPVRVRAVAGVCDAWTGGTWCRHWAAALADPGAPTQAGAIPLAPGGHAWLALLRGVPLVGRLVPVPPILPGGTLGVYRIQLHAGSCSVPVGPTCYEAVLLDAASAGQ